MRLKNNKGCLYPIQLPHRALLSQWIWHGNTSFTKPRVSVEFGLQKCFGVFLWLIVDKVCGTCSHALARSDLKLCSIIPCLALKGVAAAIARSSTLKVKVLLREYSYAII